MFKKRIPAALAAQQSPKDAGKSVMPPAAAPKKKSKVADRLAQLKEPVGGL